MRRKKESYGFPVSRRSSTRWDQHALEVHSWVLFDPSPAVGLFQAKLDRCFSLCVAECMHCIQTCMMSCVDTVLAGFNNWAFTCVGLCHYRFLDAGHNATELLEK